MEDRSTSRSVKSRGVVFVTHEIGFAREAADNLVIMADGVVVEDRDPGTIIQSPRHERTRAFLSTAL